MSNATMTFLNRAPLREVERGSFRLPSIRSTRKSTYLKALKLAVSLAALLFKGISQADPLDTWTWRNPLPTANDLFGISYGNGQFAVWDCENFSFDEPTI
jgi:hypothetical protein